MSTLFPPPRKRGEPHALFVITESRSQAALVSIRPYPRNPDGPTLQEVLTDAGFEPGDVVELRPYREKLPLPPPGQMMKRKRRR